MYDSDVFKILGHLDSHRLNFVFGHEMHLCYVRRLIQQHIWSVNLLTQVARWNSLEGPGEKSSNKSCTTVYFIPGIRILPIRTNHPRAISFCIPPSPRIEPETITHAKGTLTIWNPKRLRLALPKLNVGIEGKGTALQAARAKGTLTNRSWPNTASQAWQGKIKHVMV